MRIAPNSHLSFSCYKPLSTLVDSFRFFSSNTNLANLFGGFPQFNAHGRPLMQFNFGTLDPALLSSVFKGRLDICRLLLQCKADVGAKDNE
jgi:hypothetical protein